MKQQIKKTSRSFIEAYIIELKRSLDELDLDKIEEAIELLLEAYKKKKKVFLIGNGGSASTASHMACDLSKGTVGRVYDFSEERFRAYALTDNTALLTALANDLSFDDVFIQQMRNLLERGDVVIALSCSGNSKNVVKAINYAKKCKAKTIAFTGFNRQKNALLKLVDVPIFINSLHYGPTEDIQLILDHIVTATLARIKHQSFGKKVDKKTSAPFQENR